jgi:hypothetical protein
VTARDRMMTRRMISPSFISASCLRRPLPTDHDQVPRTARLMCWNLTHDVVTVLNKYILHFHLKLGLFVSWLGQRVPWPPTTEAKQHVRSYKQSVTNEPFRNRLSLLSGSSRTGAHSIPPGTVALSDRLTRPGPLACLEAPQQVFGCPVCHGFPTCLRAGLPVLVGGEDAHRLNATAPLRAPLRTMTSDAQISYCAALRTRPTRDLKYRTTTRVLKCTAQRVLTLRAEANELEADINQLVTTMAPQLLALPGVGPVSAAQVLISWSHPGRFRSEAAFAMFSGAAPIPASSGRTTRHRLNRSGDRQLNRALHTIVADQSTHRPHHPGLHRVASSRVVYGRPSWAWRRRVGRPPRDSSEDFPQCF